MQKINPGGAGEKILEGGQKRDFCQKKFSYFFSFLNTNFDIKEIP